MKFVTIRIGNSGDLTNPVCTQTDGSELPLPIAPYRLDCDGGIMKGRFVSFQRQNPDYYARIDEMIFHYVE